MEFRHAKVNYREPGILFSLASESSPLVLFCFATVYMALIL